VLDRRPLLTFVLRPVCLSTASDIGQTSLGKLYRRDQFEYDTEMGSAANRAVEGRCPIRLSSRGLSSRPLPTRRELIPLLPIEPPARFLLPDFHKIRSVFAPLLEEKGHARSYRLIAEIPEPIRLRRPRSCPLSPPAIMRTLPDLAFATVKTRNEPLRFGFYNRRLGLPRAYAIKLFKNVLAQNFQKNEVQSGLWSLFSEFGARCLASIPSDGLCCVGSVSVWFGWDWGRGATGAVGQDD